MSSIGSTMSRTSMTIPGSAAHVMDVSSTGTILAIGRPRFVKISGCPVAARYPVTVGTAL
jgi:hypothetical protein